MDSPQLSTPTSAQAQGQSTTISDATSSPAFSFFSKGYSARSGSSASSPASSPVPRESIDSIASKRLLEDVTEEPQEREIDLDMCDAGSQYFLDDYQNPPPRNSLNHTSLEDSPLQAEYDFDREMSPEGSMSRRQSKKQRSGDFSLPGVASRFGTRFPSLSKRWKNKSGAGPSLSIITHSDHVVSRTSSAGSSQLISPALSAISKHESYLPPSPVRTAFDDSLHDSGSTAVNIDRPLSEDTQDQDQAQATTPLLPPLMMDFSGERSPVQSPLQSPAVQKDPPTCSASTTPVSTPQMIHTLPSPPLSTKPSVASFQQRSRAGTLTKPLAEVPPMQMLDQQNDEWSQRLGHANFNIEPEPYLPEVKDLESYRQLRADWDLARSNYAKHLARTGEHYGTTSKIYLLTEEKWAFVDFEWKTCHGLLSRSVQPLIARLSDGETDQGGSTASSAVLEKPLTRVIVPQIDDSSGKFPELGDEDIIGPMAFAPSRHQQTDVEHAANGCGSRKRSFIKFLSDFKFLSEILGRGDGKRP